MDKTVIVDLYEVKERFLASYNGVEWDSQPALARQPWLKGTAKESWIGNSPDEMVTYMRDGFHSEILNMGDEYITPREFRRFTLADEGELDLQLAWSGHDYPYLSQHIESNRKAGINILADYDFSAGVKPEVIARYGNWFNGICETMEGRGYDLEISLRLSCKEMTTQRRDKTAVVVRVKRAQELLDKTDWSCVFAPGGFRMLMFAAIGVAADKINETAAGHLGIPDGREFGATYDSETFTLDITTDCRARDFNAEELTAKVDKALAE